MVMERGIRLLHHLRINNMDKKTLLSAIVLIVDNDVHSVWVVPVTEAVVENMNRLRDQVRMSGVKGVRIQRVLISEDDSAVKNIEDVSKQLAVALDNNRY